MRIRRIIPFIATVALLATSCGGGSSAPPESLLFADANTIYVDTESARAAEQNAVFDALQTAKTCEEGWDVLAEHVFAANDVLASSLGTLTREGVALLDQGEAELLFPEPATIQLYTVALWIGSTNLCQGSQVNPLCPQLIDRYDDLPEDSMARELILSGCE